MPEAIRITLPLPPSQNKATRNLSDAEKARMVTVGARRIPPRVATREMKQWRLDAGWMIQAAPKQRMAGRFRVRIYINQDARIDVDNVQKATVDLLVKHRVIPDDRFAWAIGSERSADVVPGQCIVEVAPV